jgi:hypothetical protein
MKIALLKGNTKYLLITLLNIPMARPVAAQGLKE